VNGAAYGFKVRSLSREQISQEALRTLKIIVDRFTEERITGWVRGVSEGTTVEIRLGADLYTFVANLARADLPHPTSFVYLFSDDQRAALKRGIPLTISLPGGADPVVKTEFHNDLKPVAFAFPAGEIVGRDNVRWYGSEDPSSSLFHYHNIGDSFVYDSSLKIVNASTPFVINVSKIDEAAIKNVNSHCAAVILRGSNYLNRYMDWRQAEEVFSKITVPIVCLGVGMQAPDGGSLVLSGNQLRVVKILAEKANSIGVRGYRTAEELNEFGIKNVDIIGCPTLFRNRNRAIYIPNFHFSQIRSLAFNIRREVSDDYATNVARYISIHRAILDLFMASKDVTLMTHGEIEEKIFARRKSEFYDYVTEKMLEQGWFRGLSDPLIETYKTKLFYSDTVSDYDSFVKKFPFVTGYRLHGNLMALANGVPSFYFVYDERTMEICTTFRIPYFDVRGSSVFSEDLMNQIGNFDAFNAHYPTAYQEMVNFLEKNGVPHRL